MIYLDSAATSLYKPETVPAAMVQALQQMTSPGRGTHESAMAAAECCYQCRERLAKLFHVPGPENVVFTMNATHGLNIAIHSLIHRGSRVLISGYEHNAVTRPLHAYGAEPVIISAPLFAPEQFLREAERLIGTVDAVISTHASNVFGYILPVEQLAELCRRYRKPLILDASQSAGVLEVDFTALGAEFIAMPGHKGLMGPQGTGVLLCKNDTTPLLYGGSGSESRSQTMPDFLPDRLEAGTHNVTGIAGLSAGVKYILEQGCGAIRQRELRLMERFAEQLQDCGELQLFLSSKKELQCGVLSLLPRDMDCNAFAEAMGAENVAVRAGLHCAPLAHQTAGTIGTGTVRFSFSPFNTAAQVEKAAAICKKILKKN